MKGFPYPYIALHASSAESLHTGVIGARRLVIIVGKSTICKIRMVEEISQGGRQPTKSFSNDTLLI